MIGEGLTSIFAASGLAGTMPPLAAPRAADLAPASAAGDVADYGAFVLGGAIYALAG